MLILTISFGALMTQKHDSLFGYLLCRTKPGDNMSPYGAVNTTFLRQAVNINSQTSTPDSVLIILRTRNLNTKMCDTVDQSI